MKKLFLIIFVLPILSCTEFSIEDEKTAVDIENAIELLLKDIDLISLSQRFIEIQDPLTPEYIVSILTENEISAFANFHLLITTSYKDVFNTKYNNEFYLLFNDYSSIVIHDIKCSNPNKKGQSQILLDNACGLECAGFILALASAAAGCIGPQSLFTCGLAIVSIGVATESLGQCLAANDQEACWVVN